MRFYEMSDYDALSRKAASLIAAQVVQKPDSVVGLATGSSPIGTYQQLIKWYQKGLLDFSDVTTVNLDEYKGLSHDDVQSYYYFMQENLFKHINVKLDQIHIPNGMNGDEDGECLDYERKIDQLGGVDLQLLGLGHNGHIAFNEPAAEFAKITNCVDLQPDTIDANKRFFDSIEDVPKRAYTMGIGTIMKAKKIVLIASGADKAAIVARAFEGPVTPQVPASILQFHPDVTIIATTDALGKVVGEYDY